LWKDGGVRKRPTPDNLSPDCDFSGECGDVCGDIVRPRTATLLLHDIESKYCFPDYPDRYVINLHEIGLSENVFSLIFAIRMAQFMGCNRINFVSCDAHAGAGLQTFVPGHGVIEEDPVNLYDVQVNELKHYLKDLDHSFITPKNRKEES
jgi:hypothetical protein